MAANKIDVTVAQGTVNDGKKDHLVGAHLKMSADDAGPLIDSGVLLKGKVDVGAPRASTDDDQQALIDGAVAKATEGQQALIDDAVAKATEGQQALIDDAVAKVTEDQDILIGDARVEGYEEMASKMKGFAIAVLKLETNNTDHWTTDNKPDVNALKTVADFEISAASRDKFWEVLEPVLG